MIKYLYLTITLFAAFGFYYGLYRLFWNKRALYVRMVIFGVGSAMVGRLYETVALFAFGKLPYGFNIGMLGIVGSFLFFFSANYGQMDSLVDDGSKAFRKVRIIALAAPAAVAALFLLFLQYQSYGADIAAFVLEVLVIAQASYYHLKHIIIDDVDFGVVKSIRGYNFLGLAYALLCMFEMLMGVVEFPDAVWVVWTVLMCLVTLLIVPVLERGVTKWTM